MPTWPLHHSYGGVLGDLGARHACQPADCTINPDRAWAAAGLFYLAAGLLVLISSLGLSRRELQLMCQRVPKQGWRGAARCRSRTFEILFVARRSKPLLVDRLGFRWRCNALRDVRRRDACHRSPTSRRRRRPSRRFARTGRKTSRSTTTRTAAPWRSASPRRAATPQAPRRSQDGAADLPLQREPRPRAPAYRTSAARAF